MGKKRNNFAKMKKTTPKIIVWLPFIAAAILALVKIYVPSLSWWIVTSPIWGVFATVLATMYGWWFIIALERWLLSHQGGPKRCGNCEHCSIAKYEDGRYCFATNKKVKAEDKPCGKYERSLVAELHKGEDKG